MLRLFEGRDEPLEIVLQPEPAPEPLASPTRADEPPPEPSPEPVPAPKPLASQTRADEPAPEPERASAVASAQIIAFSSAMGSPGKTSLCINVAFELASAGKRVGLVDFDLASPSLLTALNQDSITAGLAGVKRLASQGRLFAEDLHRFLMVLNYDGVKLTVLPGAVGLGDSEPRGSSWIEVADQLIDKMGGAFDYVLFDLPSLVVQPQLVAHVLNLADFGFAVSGADPVSVERWLWFKAQLEALGVRETPALVVNQVRDSVLGGNAKGQLADTFERVAKTDVISFIAQDHNAFDLALREGLPLQLAKKASPARHAISMLVRQGILNQRSRLDWRVARLG